MRVGAAVLLLLEGALDGVDRVVEVVAVAARGAHVLDDRLKQPHVDLVEVFEALAPRRFGAAHVQHAAQLGGRRLVLLEHVDVQQQPALRPA